MTSEPNPSVSTDVRSPTRRLLDRIARLGSTDTGWADDHERTKRDEIAALSDDPLE